MSALEPLSIGAKIALAGEILSEYVPTLGILRQPNVVEMVRAARDVTSSQTRLPAAVEYAVARRVGRGVGRTLRLLPTDSRCLIQSLVVTRMLTRRSVPNTLVIGIRKEDKFEAHAWVEYAGLPVLPAGDYTRLTEL